MEQVREPNWDVGAGGKGGKAWKREGENAARLLSYCKTLIRKHASCRVPIKRRQVVKLQLETEIEVSVRSAKAV